jgi:hypothetical protein
MCCNDARVYVVEYVLVPANLTSGSLAHALKRMFMLLTYQRQSLHTHSNQRSGHLRSSDAQPPSYQNVWTSVLHPGSRDGHIGMYQGAWRINVMPNVMLHWCTVTSFAYV